MLRNDKRQSTWEQHKIMNEEENNVFVFIVNHKTIHFDILISLPLQLLSRLICTISTFVHFLLSFLCIRTSLSIFVVTRISHIFFYSFSTLKKNHKLTWIIASDIARLTTQADLSSSNQVSSSTQPWKNALPVIVFRQAAGNGWRNVM